MLYLVFRPLSPQIICETWGSGSFYFFSSCWKTRWPFMFYWCTQCRWALYRRFPCGPGSGARRRYLRGGRTRTVWSAGSGVSMWHLLSEFLHFLLVSPLCWQGTAQWAWKWEPQGLGSQSGDAPCWLHFIGGEVLILKEAQPCWETRRTHSQPLTLSPGAAASSVTPGKTLTFVGLSFLIFREALIAALWLRDRM